MKTVYGVRDYTFGQEMLKLRTAISLTQERLANYLGVSGRAVRGWEAGVSYPKAEHLKALIALAVQQQAFTVGHESEEIRVFWKVAHPKMLLDEDWLCALLEHSSSPQDKETVGVVRSYDPVPNADPYDTDPSPSAHPLPPLTSMPSVEDSTSSAVPTPPPPLESGTTCVPSLDVEDGLVQGTIPTMGKRRGKRRLLMPILIALVLVTIVASAETLFFHLRNGTTTQVNKTVTDQAYPGYLSGKGTLAFFDSLSQEGKWKSGAGSSCQFIGGAYRVSTQQRIDSFSWCLADDIFSNFAIEVQLTIIQGDCGGITFRDDSNDNFYRFIICQYGTYSVSKYISASSPKTLRASNSLAIRVGLGQQNTIAVVASGSTMTFYVNERQVGQVEDSSDNSGKIALIASPRYFHVTDVAYSNAKLWTL